MIRKHKRSMGRALQRNALICTSGEHFALLLQVLLDLLCYQRSPRP